MKGVFLCLLSVWVLAGCAGTINSAGDLMNQGYKQTKFTTAAGGQIDEKIELWWKEARDTGRVLHLCAVPRIPNAGYQWAAKVYVDDTEKWDHDAGYGLPGRTGLRTGINCAASPPLPEGRMNWRFFYRYWH